MPRHGEPGRGPLVARRADLGVAKLLFGAALLGDRGPAGFEPEPGEAARRLRRERQDVRGAGGPAGERRPRRGRSPRRPSRSSPLKRVRLGSGTLDGLGRDLRRRDRPPGGRPARCGRGGCRRLASAARPARSRRPPRCAFGPSAASVGPGREPPAGLDRLADLRQVGEHLGRRLVAIRRVLGHQLHDQPIDLQRQVRRDGSAGCGGSPAPA